MIFYKTARDKLKEDEDKPKFGDMIKTVNIDIETERTNLENEVKELYKYTAEGYIIRNATSVMDSKVVSTEHKEYFISALYTYPHDINNSNIEQLLINLLHNLSILAVVEQGGRFFISPDQKSYISNNIISILKESLLQQNIFDNQDNQKEKLKAFLQSMRNYPASGFAFSPPPPGVEKDDLYARVIKSGGGSKKRKKRKSRRKNKPKKKRYRTLRKKNIYKKKKRKTQKKRKPRRKISKTRRRNIKKK